MTAPAFEEVPCLPVVTHLRPDGTAWGGHGPCRAGDVDAFPVARLSDALAYGDQRANTALEEAHYALMQFGRNLKRQNERGSVFLGADVIKALPKGATQARGAEIAALREDAERYRVLKEKIRPIYRPGHPRIELYIDGQTIAWHTTTDSDRSYSESIDAAIDQARTDGRS